MYYCIILSFVMMFSSAVLYLVCFAQYDEAVFVQVWRRFSCCERHSRCCARVYQHVVAILFCFELGYDALFASFHRVLLLVMTRLVLCRTAGDSVSAISIPGLLQVLMLAILVFCRWRKALMWGCCFARVDWTRVVQD